MSDQEENDARINSKLDKHDVRITNLEQILARTPDPKTLRHCEHIIEELPSTDELKECVRLKKARTMLFRRVIYGVVAAVAGTLVLTLISLIWQGIGLSISSGGGK